MLQASSPAASFLQSLNTNPHPRSASFGDEASASAAASGDVRRTRSLRGRDIVGLSSFGAAGEDLAGDGNSVGDGGGGSVAGSSGGGHTVPAAAAHPLFAHHAQPPAQPPCGAGAAGSGYAHAQAALGHGAPGMSAAAAALGHTSPPFHPHAHRALSTPAGSGSGFPYATHGTHEETFIDSPPMSPAESISSGGGAFSPASAFLSHFSTSAPSSHGGPAQPLAPDAEGAHVKDYVLGKFLARGGFSTVRLATNTKTGEVVACKIVRRDDLSDESGSMQRFEDELRVWQSLPKHRYIVPLLDMHRMSVATFLFMPFIQGGSLLDALMREGGSEETARKYFSGVVSAVAVLHEGFEGFEGHMMHGDLKLDNFLVDNAGGLRLGDFGMTERVAAVPPPPPQPKSHFGAHLQPRSRISSAPSGSPGGTRSSRSPHRARRDTIGGSEADCEPLPSPCPSASLPYASPELLCAPPSPPSLAQDIWAIGVILHALLTGRLPFVDSFDPRLQMKILRGQWDPPDAGYEWVEALHGCLERDVRRRWDIKRIRQCDAVSGWRSVKGKSKTRSRSRARVAVDHSIEIAHEIAHTKGHPAHHPLGNVHSHAHHHHHHHSISRDDGGLSPAHAGRGRRSRSGFRGGRPNSYPSPTTPSDFGHSRTHSQHDGYASQERSRSGGTRGDSPVASRGRPRSALDLDLNFDPRGRGSATSSAGHSPAGSRSRSRSRPNLAVRTDMRDVPHHRDIHANARAATGNADALVPDLEGMDITRGRSTQRNHPSQSGRRSPSTSSLLVPDFSFVGHEARANSRSPSAPRGGFGRGDPASAMTPAHPHNVTFTESPPSSSAPTPGAHTPATTAMDRDRRNTRSRTRRDGVQVPVPGSGPPTPGSRSTSRHRGSPGGWETRPPTLGMELDAVDEEGKARRGRSPGRQRSRSRGRMM